MIQSPQTDVPDVLTSQESKVAKPDGAGPNRKKFIGPACLHANTKKGGIRYHAKVVLFPE